MKAYVAKTPDLENEVDDVFLIIEDGDWKRTCWIRGFDDTEWKEANEFAEKIAKFLNIEFVGEIEEHNWDIDNED